MSSMDFTIFLYFSDSLNAANKRDLNFYLQNLSKNSFSSLSKDFSSPLFMCFSILSNKLTSLQKTSSKFYKLSIRVFNSSMVSMASFSYICSTFFSFIFFYYLNES